MKHLLRPVELWGRWYAQFIATRSADEAMLAEIAHYRAAESQRTAQRQWDTGDFEPERGRGASAARRPSRADSPGSIVY